MHLTTILDASEEQIRQIFDVNIIAHFLLVREFLPAMIERDHGHVVTIASMASFVTGVRNVDYSCTKAGTLAFHEGLAQELRHVHKARKIRTRSVACVIGFDMQPAGMESDYQSISLANRI